MDWPRVGLPGILPSRMECALNVEFKENLVVSDIMLGLARHDSSDRRIRYLACGARTVEFIVVLGCRERVERISAVTDQVVSLGRTAYDEHVEMAVVYEWAAGVESWTTIFSDGSDESQPDSELVEEAEAEFGYVSTGFAKFPPRDS